jgi:hypothetical protein
LLVGCGENVLIGLADLCRKKRMRDAGCGS